MSVESIKPGIDSSGTHSTRAASLGMVGTLIRSGPADVDEVLSINHPWHRPERDELFDMPRAVAGFFFQLPNCRIRWLLVRVHWAARQLPSPPARYEPMTPEHEHLVVLVHQDD